MVARYHRMKRNGACVDEHRWVWERVNGPIPVGYEIHHRNGDGWDNRIGNLELMGVSEHRSMHNHSQFRPVRLCEIEGCGRIHKGRGMCNKHWLRFYRKPRRKQMIGAVLVSTA